MKGTILETSPHGGGKRPQSAAYERSVAHGRRRTAALAGFILAAVSLALLVYSEWGCSVGFAGLMRHAALSVAFIVLGAASGLFALAVAFGGKAFDDLGGRVKRRRTSVVACVEVFAVVALACAVGGLMLCRGFAADVVSGPKTVECTLDDVDGYEPAGRSIAFRQDTLLLRFVDAEGQTIRISVDERDRTSVQELLDWEGGIVLTCYPASGVFVSAELA